MKNILKVLFLGLLPLSLFTLVSCMGFNEDLGNRLEIEKEMVNVDLKSDTLYVKKVENLTDDFIMGMDASSVIALEQSGVKYYDYDSKEEDVFKILAQSGINYIRVRVWNDPYDKDGNGYGGGNNDIDKCVEIGKRATKYGMKLLVDFHYSDFWADPAKQQAPKAWEGLDISKKEKALYEYTFDSLRELYQAGVDVGMVQVGNETNGAMCGETEWKNISLLYNAGSKAIRKVFSDALVICHFANPETANRYTQYANSLANYEVDYDVFATSYYPYWHGTLENLTDVLNNIHKKHNKKTLVVETSYAYTLEDTDFNGNTISKTTEGISKPYPYTIAGQANHINTLVDTCVNKIVGCIGVCYWEGTWISVGKKTRTENETIWEKYGSGWASSYALEYDPKDAGKYYGGCAVENQALFDENGKALESLKVFGLMKTGNEVTPYLDYIEPISLNRYTYEELNLPNQVNAIYSDNSKKEVDVTWNLKEGFEDSFKNGGNKEYVITGSALGLTTECKIYATSYNYLSNGSFEDGSKNWNINVNGSLNNDYNAGITNSNSNNPKTGSYSVHFWAKQENTVKFSFEQELSNDKLDTGDYTFSISLLGDASGQLDESLQNIYMYVLINGEEVTRKNIKFLGYNSKTFKVYTTSEFHYNEGDTLIVGIYCEATQAGSWGDFDDAMLNKVAKQK